LAKDFAYITHANVLCRERQSSNCYNYLRPVAIPYNVENVRRQAIPLTAQFMRNVLRTTPRNTFLSETHRPISMLLSEAHWCAYLNKLYDLWPETCIRFTKVGPKRLLTISVSTDMNCYK
jgi:hypothetical protein